MATGGADRRQGGEAVAARSSATRCRPEGANCGTRLAALSHARPRGTGPAPDGWAQQVAALADAPERIAIIDTPGWSFAIVEGDVVHARLDWFWRLYHGVLRDFASTSLGQPVFASNRLSSATTLNILRGGDATNDWHRDANIVTGVFYAVVPEGAGTLSFRDGEHRSARLTPRSGLFACFPGAVEHRVDPLPAGGERLAIAMVYHASPTDQPPAFGRDVYTL